MYRNEFADASETERSERFPWRSPRRSATPGQQPRSRIEEIVTRVMALYPGSFHVLAERHRDDLYWDPSGMTSLSIFGDRPIAVLGFNRSGCADDDSEY